MVFYSIMMQSQNQLTKTKVFSVLQSSLVLSFNLLFSYIDDIYSLYHDICWNKKLLIIRLPVRATPNQEFPYPSMSKTDKMAGGIPWGLCVSHSPFNGADFCGEGTANRFGSPFWNELKIIAWIYWPYIYAKWLSKYTIRIR